MAEEIGGDGRSLAALNQRAADHERRLAANELRLDRQADLLAKLAPVPYQIESLQAGLGDIKRALADMKAEDESHSEWSKSYLLSRESLQQTQRRDLQGSVLAAAGLAITLFGILLAAAVQVAIRALTK